MAEALLRQIDSTNFEAFSAGVTCQQVHPLSIEVMKEIGIDLTNKSPKTISELKDEVFDFVITFDEITARLDHSLTAAETVHWTFDDPLAVSNDANLQRRAFRALRDQILQRLRLFDIVHVRTGVSEKTDLAEDRRRPAIHAQ
jgi:protein-tyrosine-phosphatase